jgi:hypothetical protein
MPILKNARHENFAQLIAAGKSAQDAYKEVGYPASPSNPYRLKQKIDVARRIEELQLQSFEKAMKVTCVTKVAIIDSLIATRDAAKKEKQYSAAIKADELLGKTIGLFIERSEIGKPGEFEGISDRGELIEAIRERLGLRSGRSRPSNLAGSEGRSREEPDIIH